MASFFFQAAPQHLYKLHFMERSLLWNTNPYPSSQNETSRKSILHSKPQIAGFEMGFIVPSHHRHIARMKYKISRYMAHSRCPINGQLAFCPLPFTLASPWEVHLKPISSIEILPGHMEQIPRVPGSPGKSPALKKAIKDLISYHLPFQLARVL